MEDNKCTLAIVGEKKPSGVNESLAFEVKTVRKLFQLPCWPVVCASAGACQWVTHWETESVSIIWLIDWG